MADDAVDHETIVSVLEDLSVMGKGKMSTKSVVRALASFAASGVPGFGWTTAGAGLAQRRAVVPRGACR